MKLFPSGGVNCRCAVVRALGSGPLTTRLDTAGAAADFLTGAGEIADRIRGHDWSATPLGPIDAWPQSLKSAVGMVVGAPVPIVMLWGPEGVMIYNDSYSVFAGGRHPQLLGSNVREGWPEVAAFNDNVMRVGLAGGTLSYRDQELTLYRNGRPEQVWMDLHYWPLPGDDGRPAGVIATVVETTDRVLAERRELQERRRLEQVFEQAPGFICTLRGPDHVYEFVNAAHRRLFGSADWIGKPLKEAFPDIQGQGFEHLLDQVYQTGEARTSYGVPATFGASRGSAGETRVLDFVYQPMRDDSGNVTGIFCEGYDVTERRLAEAALAESQERLRLALAAAMLGTFVWFPQQDMAEADERMMAMFGLPSDGRLTLQTALAECIHPDDGPAYAAAVARALEPGGDNRLSHDIRVVQPDGSLRWLTITGQVQFEGETPVRMAGTAQDVTALRDSESRYRTLFQTIDEGFCVIEFVDGPHGALSDYVHVEANPAAAEQIGLAAVVGRGIRELAGEEAQAWIDLYGEVLRTGKSIRFEKEFQPTGRCLELAAFRIEPASRKQVAILFKDLTERQTAERALRESEAQFRAFAEAVPNHVWASRPDGHLYWFNSQVYGYAGVAEGELDGAGGWGEIVHPDDLPTAGAAWAHSLATGDLYHTEFRIRRADGEWRWFVVRAEPVRDADGAIIQWVGANIDIQDIRQQGLELERVNDILSGLLAGSKAERDQLWDLSEDMLARADYAGGLVAVNPAWTKVLGWSEPELLTNPYADIIDPDHVEATTAALTRMGETGQPTRFENRILSKDGRWTPIGWTVSPEAGGTHFIAIGRDLTEDKAREQQLLRTQEALRQSQKMEAVGQLTGGIAHDFNNLLAGISGSLELLDKRIGEGRLNGVDRYIDAAQGAARRAAALTQRLLAFSRRQTLDPKPIDVNRLIAGMEDLIRRSVGPTVDVEVVGADGLWATRMDPSQLENALLNLCINSRDAMAPEGGRLTIETANRRLDERAARERDLPPGQYVSLCVSDTGTGMSPDVIAQAFDPFFTTKPLGQGTGLGLSMIHGFVRQSGGQVRICSEIGKGTTLCLYLPRFAGEAADIAPSPADPGGAAGQGETVLLIDDEPTVRMLMLEVLTDAGYKTLEAGDGPSGLAILASDVRIDLLITDVGLPGGMNGRQVADAARETRPDLKVLFVTGYAENAAVGDGNLDVGMELLTKPFVMAELGARVRDIIRG